MFYDFSFTDEELRPYFPLPRFEFTHNYAPGFLSLVCHIYSPIAGNCTLCFRLIDKERSDILTIEYCTLRH